MFFQNIPDDAKKKRYMYKPSAPKIVSHQQTSKLNNYSVEDALAGLLKAKHAPFVVNTS